MHVLTYESYEKPTKRRYFRTETEEVKRQISYYVDSHGTLPRRREKRLRLGQRPISSLEKLPPEILQKIHCYGANCSLPLATPLLASSLTSTFVFLHFSSHILHEPPTGADSSSEEQTRLLACRFFTFRFLRQYIDWAYELHERRCQASNLDTIPPAQLNGNWKKDDFAPYLKLNNSIMLPMKLFRGPWRGNKMHFITFLLNMTGYKIPKHSPRRELALQGLRVAIDEGESYPFSVLRYWVQESAAAWQYLLEYAYSQPNDQSDTFTMILNYSCRYASCLKDTDTVWKLAGTKMKIFNSNAESLYMALINHIHTYRDRNLRGCH